MRTLQKIQQDQATGLLLAPFWSTQAWWPTLTRMLIQAPLVLPNRNPVASGINFLADLYHKGLSYSALNIARSALASVIVLPGNQSFGNHPLVSRFLKGTFATRPALPKYKEVWDVNTVLEHLKTLHPAESLC